MDQDSATTGLSRIAGLLAGAALGALGMYLADPDRGRRRRALATDKLRSTAAKTRHAVDVASRDLGNRMQGVRARTRRLLFKRNIAADDQIVAARVRQQIGRAVSHPHAVHVFVQQGRVILSGLVLAHEKQQLLDHVRGVHDVRELDDQLQVHQHADGIPALQGSGRPIAAATQERWAPGLRAAALLGGGALGIAGLTARRAPANLLLTAAGLALMARGMFNLPLRRMLGADLGRQSAIDLQKTIHIAAAPGTVFDLWSRYENFPRFMSNVREVRDLGNGRSHWVVSGPAGTRFEWDAELTESRRPDVLAWRSTPDSPVQHDGVIHFAPEGDGTRVTVQMSYQPPAGGLGHAVASLFDGDPERQMDDDLWYMKEFIEAGQVPRETAPTGPQTSAILH